MKGKDSYRELQYAFYNYMTERGFKLQRGQSTGSEHISVETLKNLTGFDEVESFLKTDFPEPVEIGEIPHIIDDKYAQKYIVEPLQEQNTNLIMQNLYLRRNLNVINENIKLLGDSEKENKRLKRENKKLTKENEDLKYDINLYDRLLTTLQNTVNKFISWVSSMFNVSASKIAKRFEKDTNTHINPMEQLITENEDLKKELEERYSR